MSGQGAVTGKPLEMGGIQGRTEATGLLSVGSPVCRQRQSCKGNTFDLNFPPGLGVYFGVREALRHPDILQQTGMTEGLEDKTVVVQGFGNGMLAAHNVFVYKKVRLAPDSFWRSPPVSFFLPCLLHCAVGYHTALYFQQKGGSKVVAVAERDGYIYSANGLDIPALKEHFDKTGSILGFHSAETFVSLTDSSCGGLLFTALDHSTIERHFRCLSQSSTLYPSVTRPSGPWSSSVTLSSLLPWNSRLTLTMLTA